MGLFSVTFLSRATCLSRLGRATLLRATKPVFWVASTSAEVNQYGFDIFDGLDSSWHEGNQYHNMFLSMCIKAPRLTKDPWMYDNAYIHMALALNWTTWEGVVPGVKNLGSAFMSRIRVGAPKYWLAVSQNLNNSLWHVTEVPHQHQK